MKEPKTKVTNASVTKFLDGITDEVKRADSHALVGMLRAATKKEPKMWGSSIVGFGEYHFIGKSGGEGDWPVAGMSPRKQSLTLYMLGGWTHNPELLGKLGKYSHGKGCLYIKRLDDVNLPVLKRLIAESLKRAKKVEQMMAAERVPSASELISNRIAELPDWRGTTLARMRKLIKSADPGVVEEWKWMNPVWSHDGIICTGESYKKAVKLTFARGASLRDPARLFNSSLDGNVRRAIDIHEGEKVDEAAFKALIRQAVALNRADKPKSSKKGKKSV